MKASKARLIVAVVAVWLVAASLSLAQVTKTVSWTHDGLNVTYFEVVVDGTATNVGIPTPSNGWYSASVTFAAKGQYWVWVNACLTNEDETTTCTSSAKVSAVIL